MHKLKMGAICCLIHPAVSSYQICALYQQDFDRYRYTHESEKKWHIDKSIQMSLMHQESGFRPLARPTRSYLFGIIPWSVQSSALGYSQALVGTWSDYEKASPSFIRSRVLFKDAADFVGWYLNRCVEKAGIPRHDISRLYLCYHEGIGGYTRGTYKKKTWLVERAKKLVSTNKLAQKQLAECESDLRWSHLYFL